MGPVLCGGSGEVTLGGPRDDVPALGFMRSYLAYRNPAKIWSVERILNFCILPIIFRQSATLHATLHPFRRPSEQAASSLLHGRFHAPRPPQRGTLTQNCPTMLDSPTSSPPPAQTATGHFFLPPNTPTKTPPKTPTNTSPDTHHDYKDMGGHQSARERVASWESAGARFDPAWEHNWT